MDLRIVEMLGIVRLAKRCVLVPILGSNFAIVLLRAVLYLCELNMFSVLTIFIVNTNF